MRGRARERPFLHGWSASWNKLDEVSFDISNDPFPLEFLRGSVDESDAGPLVVVFDRFQNPWFYHHLVNRIYTGRMSAALVKHRAIVISASIVGLIVLKSIYVILSLICSCVANDRFVIKAV